MGKEVWTEEVDEVIGVDKNGEQVTKKVTVQYYKIVCDYCGKEIINTKEGLLGNAYIEVQGKYYHPECYEIMKLS